MGNADLANQLTQELENLKDEIDHCFKNGYTYDNLGTLILHINISQVKALKLQAETE